MIRNLIIIAILVMPTFIYSQKKHQVANSSVKINSINNSVRQDIGKDAFQVFIDSFKDSINNAKSIDMLPVFLKDTQFDYKYAAWSNLHKPISLRRMIIQKITNCKSLNLIINSNNIDYGRKPIEENKILLEFSEFSNLQFAINRLRELKCR